MQIIRGTKFWSSVRALKLPMNTVSGWPRIGKGPTIYVTAGWPDIYLEILPTSMNLIGQQHPKGSYRAGPQ